MKATALYVLLFAAFTCFQASAQLITWSPTGVSNFGVSPWSATASNSNLAVGGLTRGAGVSTNQSPANNAWGGNAWGGGATQDVTFTVTSVPGCTVSYSSFNLFYRRSGTGPATGTLEYSFGTNTYTVINSFNFSNSTSSGAAHAPIALGSVADLQSVPPGTVIKFRILPTGGASTGTWYIFSSGLSVSGSVTVAPVYTVSVSQTASIQCNGQLTGALTASVTGGNAPYTYSWAPAGGTSSLATGLAAGIYTCIAIDASLAVTSTTYNLYQPTAITSSVSSQSNASCFGLSDGSATLSVTGGSGAYTYSWLPVSSASSSVSGLAAGMYTCTIADANNCTTSQTLAITQPTDVVIANASSSVICSGSSIILSGSGASTYTWSSGVTDGSSFSRATSATYTVSGTNTLSGCTSASTILIVVNNNPTVTAAASSTAICSGQSFSLTPGGANTYTWSSNVTNASSLSPTSTAAYTVNATDVNGCPGTATVGVTVNQNPTVTAVTTSSAVCQGQTVTITAAGAATYTWSGNVLNGTAFSPTLTNTYSVNATDMNGCTSSSTVMITVNANPTITVNTSSMVVCSGNTAVLTASGATTYTWSNGVVNGGSFSPSVAATYTVNGTGPNGCPGSATVGITVNPSPTVTITSNKIIICAGQAATLTASSAASFSWNTNQTSASISVTPTITTTYTATGTAANGCSSKATITQSVQACTGISENNSNAVSDVIVYPNPNNGNFTVKVGSSFNVTIVNNMGAVVEHASADETNNYEIQINNLENGIYFITGRNETGSFDKKVIVIK